MIPIRVMVDVTETHMDIIMQTLMQAFMSDGYQGFSKGLWMVEIIMLYKVLLEKEIKRASLCNSCTVHRLSDLYQCTFMYPLTYISLSVVSLYLLMYAVHSELHFTNLASMSYQL